MNTLIIITISVLGILSIFLQAKKEDRFLRFFNLLVFSAVAVLLTPDFNESSSSVVYALIGLVSINFIASQVKVLQKEYIRILVPLISVVSF